MSTDKNWTVLSYTGHKSDRNHCCWVKVAILDSEVRIREVRLTFRGENPEMSISVLNASLLTFALSYRLTCCQHELQYQSPTQDEALKVRAHLHLSFSGRN